MMIVVLLSIDGEPNDKHSVATVIQDAANRIKVDEELSVSFIQVFLLHPYPPPSTLFASTIDDVCWSGRLAMIVAPRVICRT